MQVTKSPEEASSLPDGDVAGEAQSTTEVRVGVLDHLPGNLFYIECLLGSSFSISVCLSTSFIHLSIYPSIHPSIHPSHLSVYLSIPPSHLFSYPSNYLSIHPSHLSIISLCIYESSIIYLYHLSFLISKIIMPLST